jgi:hypothetical protein
MKEIKVDLGQVVHKKETALIGRENGENALENLNKKGIALEEIEKNADKIIIAVPEHVVSINQSYFLGMFETSVERLGRKGFLDKYQFEATDHIKKKVRNHVDASMSCATQEDILNA